MANPNTIEAGVFCIIHQIDYTFIKQLHEYGVLETAEEAEKLYIPEDQLPVLEKMVRLHTEMDINAEGIETIYYLLQRMEKMQSQITQLQNKLAFHENI